ncbi:MAG: DUF697 domain-containing protein [Desulfobacterales bacterium]|nr:DUF697 domain-containing protein [Desulfobacterales bacterium]
MTELNEKKTETTSQDTDSQDTASQDTQIKSLIRNHVIAAMGISLVPIPVLDIVGITGVQVNMIRKFAKAYDVPFSESKVKSILGALIGGGSVLPIGHVFNSLLKTVPWVGQTVAPLAMVTSSGAITYAVGKVFNAHFASGGTLLTFNPEEVKEYYAEMLKEGKDVAQELKTA